jgi:hypothetical protein
MLLARLFAWLDRVLGGPGGAQTAAEVARVSAASSRPPAPLTPLAGAALLSVDGGGQVLLCGAERLTLGHLRAARADLGFLADVGVLHAELVRSDSLHAGPGWSLAPLGADRVTVDGRPVGREGVRLADGARVKLGENLELVARLPDPASASVVLELLHGAECAGARHVVLLARGAGGRVRIGAARPHHVRVPNLEFELALQWEGDALVLTGDLPLSGPHDAAEERVPRRVPFPPPARVAFTCGKPHGSRPPFGLSLEPVLRPGA